MRRPPPTTEATTDRSDAETTVALTCACGAHLAHSEVAVTGLIPFVQEVIAQGWTLDKDWRWRCPLCSGSRK